MTDQEYEQRQHIIECRKWFNNFESFFNENLNWFLAKGFKKEDVLFYAPLNIKTMIYNAMAYMATLTDGNGTCPRGLMEREYRGDKIHYKEIQIMTGYEDAFIMVAPFEKFLKRKEISEYL